MIPVGDRIGKGRLRSGSWAQRSQCPKTLFVSPVEDPAKFESCPLGACCGTIAAALPTPWRFTKSACDV
jgi:hypothetical protein